MPGRSSATLDAHVKHHLLYVGQLLLVAAFGYLLILPWALAWATLHEHYIVPIFSRWAHCCGSIPDDPITVMGHTYAVFDPLVAGPIALLSSLLLSTLLRVHWAILWALFCASVYLGIRAFAHSRFGANALFMF